MNNFQQGWQPPQNQQYAPQQPPPMPPYMQPPFYGQPLPDVVYDGDARNQIGIQLLLGILVIVTLGLGAPYAICFMHQEDAEHTIVGGRRLRFDGTARELFFLMFAWGFFTVLTLGIYTFWARIEYKKWIAEHTHFA